jgi:hypothetical protein
MCISAVAQPLIESGESTGSLTATGKQRGLDMTAVAHDGGHALIVVIGLVVAGIMALFAWLRDR